MSFTAFTYNLQHGQGTDSQFNFQRQVDSFNPADLIAVQERSNPGTETGWNTPLSNAGYTQSIYRANQIGGTDGNQIWYKTATVSVISTYECQLSVGAQTGWSGTNVDKSAVGAKVQIENQLFYFIAAHLSQAAGADSQGALTSVIRENQIKTLLAWIDSEMLGLDVLLGADFNYAPNHLLNAGGFQMDLFLRAGFVDLWREGMSRNAATVNWGDRNSDGTADQIVSDNSVTHDNRRIDSLYLRRVNRAITFESIDIPDLRATCSTSLTGSPAYCPDITDAAMRWGNSGDYGPRPTDHNPVKGTFSINQKAVSPVRATPFSWLPNKG